MSEPDFSEGAAYVRGRFVPLAQAAVPVTDWGFSRSDVVYDVVHVYRGGFFRLADHLDRFHRAMAARQLAPAESREEMEAVLHRCVALAGLDDAYVSMMTLRGRPRVRGSRRPADCDNHFMAYAAPWIDVIPPEVQARGAHLMIASNPRIPDASVDPTVKNFQWSDLTTSVLEAHANNYDTSVLCDADGFVTEGPGFNVFVVQDGRIVTPDRGSLQGITRRSVLDICAELGIEAAIAPVTRDMLENADEVFAATTAGGVMPVARIGTASGVRILGNDRPGPISALIREEYWKRHEAGWHMTPVRRELEAPLAAGGDPLADLPATL